MTPDEARRLLDGTTPGPWEWVDCDDEGGGVHMALRNPAGDKAVITEDAESYQSGVTGTPEDLRLCAAAPTLAAMIAGMREEYQAEQQVYEEVWLPLCGWYDHDTAQFFAEHVGEGVTRIVRRYVTTPEEA